MFKKGANILQKQVSNKRGSCEKGIAINDIVSTTASSKHYRGITQEVAAWVFQWKTWNNGVCTNAHASTQKLLWTLLFAPTSASALWISESFLRVEVEAIADVPAQWCHHKMSFRLLPYELCWIPVLLNVSGLIQCLLPWLRRKMQVFWLKLLSQHAFFQSIPCILGFVWSV